ncbi:VOC family protein [Chloroflexota bacterium]
MAKSLDHVCILVKDIDQAIEHYTNILGAVAPEVLERKTEKTEAYAGTDRYLTTVFTVPGDGCNIQLLQPLNPESPLYKRLQRYGEHIHHLGFTSSHLEKTVQLLREKSVSLHLGGEQLFYNVEDPTAKWTWILPGYAHGALIEVMSE